MKLTENFYLSEYRSKDGAETPKDLIPNIQKNADNLQVLRDYLDVPIVINSGYRSPSHNKAVGGVSNSYHLGGMASDIIAKGYSPNQVANAIEKLIHQGKMSEGGIGRYKTFTHYDVRGYQARW